MKEGWNGVEKEAVRPWGGWFLGGWLMGEAELLELGAVLCRVQLKNEYSS